MAINIGVLASGRGSNLQALIRSASGGRLGDARIRVVISNKENARALDIARENRIGAVYLPSESPEEIRWSYDSKLVRCLIDSEVTPEKGLVVLAGYMRILSSEFVRLYAGRILNIHPSLLPLFPELNAQRQALEYGVKVSGCTVHFVDEGVDTGPIILQSAVSVREDDTVESLSERILAEEHRVYSDAVRLFVGGKLRLEGRRVRILE
jgi:phosphoribosylglycinamide formyltransferase-1